MSDNILEEQYKLHSKIVKLYNTIKSGGDSDDEDVQRLLRDAYDLKHISKKNAISFICQSIDKTKPLHLDDSAKKLMYAINDMNNQHDAKLDKVLHLFENKGALAKFQNTSKKLVRYITKNYNDYYDGWSKMKELECRYKAGYKKYQANREKYKNGSIPVPKAVAVQLIALHDELTRDIIPEFKKFDKILDHIEAELKELVEKFNQLYLSSVNDDQFRYITLPITALDVYKKCYDVSGRKRPVAKIPVCIDQSWDDAVKAGFNITLFSPCNVIKQTDVVDCKSEYDWPYIEYEPNLFTAWDLGQNQLQWISRCFCNRNIRKIRRPSIGLDR